ncbi:hypothetical protein Anas_06362 [Armadillidium nasatum]|uniref:RING-type domain-containing protein n=1 Tax=Armadillidium nasatum TaxID=96803 RepID=A0A5N5SRK2_9CRUS|nr:hypothetical protein Anas_06362 [Armadillidium nasatum]
MLYRDTSLRKMPIHHPLFDFATTPVFDNNSASNNCEINYSFSTSEVMEEYQIPEFDGIFACEGAPKELLKDISEFNYKSNKDQRCEICLQIMFNTITSIIPCGHLYHSNCIKKCLNKLRIAQYAVMKIYKSGFIFMTLFKLNINESKDISALNISYFCFVFDKYKYFIFDKSLIFTIL